MGDRINYVFKTDEKAVRIVLYSHWGAPGWRHDLAKAIRKAEPRLAIDDTGYSLRIILDQLMIEGRDGELGFGIYLIHSPFHQPYWDAHVEVDMTTQLVNDDGTWRTFKSFSEYNLEEINND